MPALSDQEHKPIITKKCSARGHIGSRTKGRMVKLKALTIYFCSECLELGMNKIHIDQELEGLN